MDSDLQVLHTESLCPEGYFKNDGRGQDLYCDVFIEITIEGLALVHFKVELLSPEDIYVKEYKMSKVARTEVVFRYDAYDYEKRIQGKEVSGGSTILMNSDIQL